MTWRVAKSLDVLLHQINDQYPGRDKSSDGSIGDASHQTRDSDHNPWIQDPDGSSVVSARDFTNDPAHGLSSQKLAEALVASRDARIKYVISNRQICSGTGQKQQAWAWRKYAGSNPHDHHCHLSVKEDKAHYDDTRPWLLNVAPPDNKVVPLPTPTSTNKPSLVVLHLGSTGPDVTQLQILLNKHGATLDLDGNFGPVTRVAVISFQRAQKLVPDGIVGRYTWDALAGKA